MDLKSIFVNIYARNKSAKKNPNVKIKPRNLFDKETKVSEYMLEDDGN